MGFGYKARSVGWPVGRPVGRPVSRSVGRSVGRLVGRSVGRSAGRSVGRSVIFHISFCFPVPRLSIPIPFSFLISILPSFPFLQFSPFSLSLSIPFSFLLTFELSL